MITVKRIDNIYMYKPDNQYKAGQIKVLDKKAIVILHSEKDTKNAYYGNKVCYYIENYLYKKYGSIDKFPQEFTVAWG